MSKREELKAKRVSVGVSSLLRAERERLEVSKNELSQRSGVSRTAIRLIEEGKRQPTIYTAALLCASLGISLADLVKRVEQS